MISLATIAKNHQREFKQTYRSLIENVHLRALQQIIQCHTPQAGVLCYRCDECQSDTVLYRSCGHRHCPACQHNVNNHWLDGQRQKLLPVDYYLVTFTIPRQLRPFFWHHQKWAYDALLKAAKETLLSFFERDPNLGENTGFISVLHTNSRAQEYHPHAHFIVPNGGLNSRKKQWRSKRGEYLFNGDNLATVFRGKFIALMLAAHYYLPKATPKEWVADCKNVGRGEGALTYLSRYLYRGVISEDNILSFQNGLVTFRYKESKSKQYQTICESACQFLWRILQHVLPKGFRRTRNYGFLHGNAKGTLRRLQLILKVFLPMVITEEKAQLSCPKCKGKLHLYEMRIGKRVIVIESK